MVLLGQEHTKTEWAEDRTVTLFQHQRLVNALCRCFVAIALLIGSFSAAAEVLPDPVKAGWQGASVCEVLHDDATLRVFRCTFPPGVGHERHFHAAHFGYALTGGVMRITDERGTRTVTLEAGSSFYSEGVVWHVGLNVGETTDTYLMMEPK